MNKQLYIKDYCHIKNNTIFVNDSALFQAEESLDFSEFFNAAYKNLNINYPKAFKMDNLSKLSFLAADVLLKDDKISSETNRDIALIFSNSASSLDTDRKYQKSIDDAAHYYPSPSVFVYTLPNIGMGEISIKHRLFSENSFFIFDRFNATYLHHYAVSMLSTNKAKYALCGWVDFDETAYEAFLYWVGDKGIIPHTEAMITNLYTKN
ncbi:hypothetical protein ATE92_1375 [Ulvibacter sp. MAR_2010_11]|uniref:3-oxoacyl-ACP synthase n=1 Tax=Ulvibacter sp. MAR_2010_11 TaxID=1250229 RepID=UPI000C2C4DF9|nr:3-oxoacyl-ACP synthase [Ulvibacter sp. MAR_2010_11]PKA83225.1 hypothetical protein ATE92_1375 [Ulvibacter sp. MAR_2010_11]